MLFPTTTSIFAAALALVYVAMTAWVMAGRTSKGTLQGDGGTRTCRSACARPATSANMRRSP